MDGTLIQSKMYADKHGLPFPAIDAHRAWLQPASVYAMPDRAVVYLPLIKVPVPPSIMA